MNNQSLRPQAPYVVAALAAVLSLFAFTLPPAAQAQKKEQTAAKAPEQQSKGITQTYNEAPIRTLPDKTKRYAVIIGVDKYTSDEQIPSLVGAGNDARLLADALVKYAGFPTDQVVVLSSDQTSERLPIKSNIYKILNGLKGQVGKDGMLVVAFSGHGIQQNGHAFLLPQDALSNRDMIEDYGIPVDSLKERIRRTNAGQVILFLDACRNEPEAAKGDADNPLTKEFKDEFDLSNQGIEAFVTIYAASVGQRAWEDKTKKQGYFTMTLVEGLKGEAADPQTGRVTLQSLIHYVGEQVPKRVKRANIDREQKPYAEVGGDYKAADLLLSRVEPKNPVKPPVAAATTPVVVAPVTGSLAVLSNPGARIFVEAVAGGFKTELKGDKDAVSLKDLKPGEYKLKSELEGFNIKEGWVKVAAGSPAFIPLLLDPVTHSVTIKTNVNAGKVLFGLKGGTQSVADIKDKQITLNGLQHGGEYVFNVSTAEVGYLSKTETRVVSKDMPLDVNLERSLADQPIEAGFTNADWDAPASWRLSPGLQLNGAGIGLLRPEAGRFANLQIWGNVELTSGSGVSFVIRAVDKQNYYLVRLSGPKAGNSPDMLRFYVVKDGKPQQIGSSVTLKGFNLNEQFDFTITAKDNQFDFTITDNKGRPESAGRFFDRENTFTSGAVGVAANADEQAKIGRFYVCPNQCQ